MTAATLVAAVGADTAGQAIRVAPLGSDDRARFLHDGFVVVPGVLPPAESNAAQQSTRGRWPDAASIAGSPSAGIEEFPFSDPELSLLTVHAAVLDVAETLLGTAGVRLYHAEAWAKHTGAATYEQQLHRDYVNHTLVVPSPDPRYGQVLFFLYLTDVSDTTGAPRFVPTVHAADEPWLPQAVDRGERRALYAAEVSAPDGPGTLVAYRPDTFHRAVELTAPGARRQVILMSFRTAATEWGHRYGWADRGHWPGMPAFVERASPRQRTVVGFPPPGHPYWTPATIAGVAARYPGMDLSPYRVRR
jgi:hypothetical protein